MSDSAVVFNMTAKVKVLFQAGNAFFVVVVFFEVYVKVTLCPGKFNHLYCAFMYLKYWIHAAYYSHNLRKLLQRLELLRHLMLNFFGGWALCRLKTNRRHTHKLQVELGGENIIHTEGQANVLLLGLMTIYN